MIQASHNSVNDFINIETVWEAQRLSCRHWHMQHLQFTPNQITSGYGVINCLKLLGLKVKIRKACGGLHEDITLSRQWAMFRFDVCPLKWFAPLKQCPFGVTIHFRTWTVDQQSHQKQKCSESSLSNRVRFGVCRVIDINWGVHAHVTYFDLPELHNLKI